MKTLLCFCYCIYSYIVFCDSSLVGAVVSMTAVSSAESLIKDKDKGLFSWLSSADDFLLEEVMLIADENTNNHGALKVHIVILYNKEVFSELMRSSSSEYFSNIEQLVKDHPNEIKIFEWQLVAKKTISPWIRLEYPNNHMKPVGALVFANYNNGGVGRSLIPKEHARIKITFGENDFNITPENNEDE